MFFYEKINYVPPNKLTESDIMNSNTIFIRLPVEKRKFKLVLKFPNPNSQEYEEVKMYFNTFDLVDAQSFRELFLSFNKLTSEISTKNGQKKNLTITAKSRAEVLSITITCKDALISVYEGPNLIAANVLNELVFSSYLLSYETLYFEGFPFVIYGLEMVLPNLCKLFNKKPEQLIFATEKNLKVNPVIFFFKSKTN